MIRTRRKKANPNLTPTGVLSKKARKVLQAATTIAGSLDNKMFANMYIYATEQALYNNNKQYLMFIKQLREPPVDIEVFLDSPEFMGATDLILWPEVRRAIVNSCKYWWKGWATAINEILLMGATGTGKCVSSDTEYLTPTGWRYISEYDGGVVAQYTEDGRAEFVQPTRYVKEENDYLYTIANKTVDMSITPAHRVVYTSRKSPRLQTQTADSFVAHHESTPSGFQGRFITTYQAPDRDGIKLTDNQIRLMIAVMADGTFPSHSKLTKWCSITVGKSRKIKRLRRLLHKTRVSYREKIDSRGYTSFQFYAPQRNKTYEGWWDASSDQLCVIDSEVLFWDGDTKANFYTGDKGTADFIQYVFSTSGHRSTISVTDRTHLDQWVSKEYRVRRAKSPYATFSGRSDQKVVITRGRSPDGYHYCFTVPTGMFITRRKGKVCITHNSEIAKVCTAYHLHILGCMDKPQRYWGLPEATSIVMTIQAAKPHVTKKIIYLPLRAYVETMPWFRRHMRPNKILEGEMYFEDQNIRVVQGGSDSDAVLGDALIGGVVDEINFMNVVENSKKAGMGTGRSSNYDQAQMVYDTVTRRKKSRFMSRGPNVGAFCIASSTRYKNDFTDRRKEQVERLKDKTVYVYNKAQYEVRPEDKYCGDKFRLLVANEAAMDIRVLEDDENVHGGTVIEVPVEYKEDFEKDAPGALRDIVGRSVNSINPFFRQQAKIMYCVNKGEDNGLKSFLHKDNVVLGFEGLPMPVQGHYCTNPSKPRYVHIDLSNTGDSCGVAMLRYDGIEWIGRDEGEPEALPIATVEMAVGIEPDQGHEIDIAEVRAWVKMLRNTYGYPIKAVSYDGWQSLESMQAWKKQGMKTGLVSVDRTSAPYKQLRDALYDGRIFMYNQPVLIDELFGLEYDEKKDKIDHPITGSKDVADAVCGAYHTLVTRSSSWVLPGGGGDPSQSDRTDFGDRFETERPA